jgi:ketosteroid isomerase-like protein
MNDRTDGTDAVRRFATRAFADWSNGNRATLFDAISPDVRWTVSGTCPGGGTYYTKDDFAARSSGPVQAKLVAPMKPIVDHVHADGDTAFVRWHGETRTKDGQPYRNAYCWVLRFERGTIVEITSYLDSLAVAKLFTDGLG